MKKDKTAHTKIKFIPVVVWIFFILGISLYIFGFKEDSELSVSKISIIIAEVLVTSALVGFLINTTFLHGFLDHDLNISHSSDFINSNNSEIPFNKISKPLINYQKYPDIFNRLLNAIIAYIPTDQINYISDYNINMTICWEDRKTGTFIIDYDISFNIISSSKKKIILPIYSLIKEVNQNDNDNSNVKDLIINGQHIIVKKTPKTDITKEEIVVKKEEIILSGNTSYFVNYTRRTQCNINYDNYISFRTRFLVNNLHVNLFLPEDLEAVFVSRGTQHDYLTLIHEPTRKEMKYDGIILRNQGYIFVLNPKRSS